MAAKMVEKVNIEEGNIEGCMEGDPLGWRDGDREG